MDFFLSRGILICIFQKCSDRCSEKAKDATGLKPVIVANVRKDAEITTG